MKETSQILSLTSLMPTFWPAKIFPRYPPNGTKNAPQMKNCKNIITDRRIVVEGFVAGMGG